MTDITPKPMSAERRAEIESLATTSATFFPALFQEAVFDLLADAAYWHVAV